MEIKTSFWWVDGKFVEWDKLEDHNLTHALHYGSWAFEWIRFYETSQWPKIFRLKEHIDRLFFSASVLNIQIPFSKEEIIKACQDLVIKNNIKNWYIRPIVYYGYGKMWLYPKWADIKTVITVWKWGKYLSEKPIDIVISSVRRLHPDSTNVNAKLTWNYINSVLVSLDIHKKWFDEGLLLDTDWFIAEWPGENIFFIKDNKLYTPSIWNILPGITRSTIIQIAKEQLNIETVETKIKPGQLSDFQEAFFVGTAAEVTSIGSITDETWKKVKYDYNVILKIQKLYMNIVTWKLSEYLDWLY